MRLRRHLGLALLLCTLGPRPAGAQRWQADVVGTRVAFDTAAAVTALTVAPLAQWRTRTFYATATGALSVFDGAGWALQGRSDASLLIEPLGSARGVQTELLGLVAGTEHSSGFGTGTVRTEARVHLAGYEAGGWIGATTLAGWTSAEAGARWATGPTLAVWGRYARLRGALIMTPLRTAGDWFPEVNAYVTMSHGPVDLAGYLGVRSAPAGSVIGDDAWGGASAEWWVSARAAVVASVGSYAPDLLQGLPGGRYVSLGVRVARERQVTPSVRPLGRPVYSVESAAGAVRFRVPAAARVAIVGDWTNWEPVPMTAADGDMWEVRVSLAPGVYRFNLIVDGGRWIVPDGVPSVDDGFGGRAGLLIVTR